MTTKTNITTQQAIETMLDDTLNVEYYLTIEWNNLLLEYNENNMRIREIVNLENFSKDQMINAIKILCKRFDFSFNLHFSSYEEMLKFF